MKKVLQLKSIMFVLLLIFANAGIAQVNGDKKIKHEIVVGNEMKNVKMYFSTLTQNLIIEMDKANNNVEVAIIDENYLVLKKIKFNEGLKLIEVESTLIQNEFYSIEITDLSTGEKANYNLITKK